MKDYRVIGLRLKDGKIAPLAWTIGGVAKKELRRATRKFMRDSDVVAPSVLPWERLYDNPAEMKAELPPFA